VLSPSARSALRLSCEARHRPTPGQVYLAAPHGTAPAYATTLYPLLVEAESLLMLPAQDIAWPIGTSLDVLGPIGNGFNPPSTARRWLLASFKQHPDRLLPLIDLGLGKGVTISLLCNHQPLNLPPQVELNPEPEEALAWAQYLVIHTSIEALPAATETLGLSGREAAPCPAQVLIEIPMPCGLGVCQACAIRSRKGTKLVCADGPVFDLQALIW